LLPLAALTFAVALATSRYGLVIHELVGHGGTALALGGHIDAVRLFWFGGGWVSYHADAWSTSEILAVTLGGIAVEWLAAAVLVAIAWRRSGVARLVLAGAATGFVIHGGMYLALGTYYGMGDGTIVHHLLGAWRPLVWAPAAAICVVAAWLGAAVVTPILRTFAPARRQLALIGVALVAGGALHVGLLVAEHQLRVDPVYTAIMRTDGQRQVERDVAAAQAQNPQVTPDELAQIRRASEERHRPFPFGPLLVALITVSAIASMMRTRPAPDPRPLPWRDVAAPALVAAVGVILVALIDTLT
jgi:hypothetical protein